MLAAIEVLAVISGAIFGVLLARRKQMDFVGVFAVACITAFGGGDGARYFAGSPSVVLDLAFKLPGDRLCRCGIGVDDTPYPGVARTISRRSGCVWTRVVQRSGHRICAAGKRSLLLPFYSV